MARINDGNLLQHFTECFVAERLVAAGDGGLRLVATHAMAPFEPARNPETHEHNARLRNLLRALPAESATAVVRAYAAVEASATHYPNSAELIAGLIGRAQLDGVLCEVDADARLALERAWPEDRMQVDGRSWRDALAAGALFPPEELGRPWLVSLDPYSWLLDGEAKKEARGPYLVREDLETLRPLLAAHAKSGQPGACTIFAYKADPQHAKGFRTHVLRVADRLGLERAVLGIPGPEGTRHLGIVLSSLVDLAAETAEAWHAYLAEG